MQKKLIPLFASMTCPESSPDNELEPMQESGSTVSLAPLAGLQTLVARLFASAGAIRFGVSVDVFAAWLAEVAANYLPPDAEVADVRELLSAIHVEDLVLARACAAGNEAAWEAFLLRYREMLYEAGVAIAKDYGIGRELADSLYADLWGAGRAHGRSPLAMYMGHGSLGGYLRTIMGRSFIDRCRSTRRLVSLEEETDKEWQLTAPPQQAVAAPEPRLEEATDEALCALTSEDRYILASFFLHGRTLAEVAAVLGLHESTVSRRVSKITAKLRKGIIAGMVRRGLSRRQAEEALEIDVRDLHVNVRARLQENLQETAIQPSSKQRANAARPKNDV